MALSEFALNEEPIGSDEVGTFAGGLSYWLILNQVLEPAAAMESIDIEDSLGGSNTARFRLYNPSVFPQAGQSVEIIWEDQTLFGGQLVTASLRMEQAETREEWSCEAVGWMRILERRLITARFTNQTFKQIAQSVLVTHLLNEGIVLGTVDEGPVLTLADADDIRLSEFLRDVAQASGGILILDPYRRLQFRTLTVNPAPFLLTEADVMDFETEEDLDQYRNRQFVTVTGTGGASANVMREDATEIATRMALEGGTGIYEASDRVTHPTSNSGPDLERLGISVALVKLAALARVKRTFKARTRRPSLQLGQIVSVDMAGYRVSGEWQIVRMMIQEVGTELWFTVEAQRTNFQQLVLDSLLRIVDAGRATVALPVADFATLDTITTLGDSTYTVVGSGMVELEITVYGAGAGGQAGRLNLWSKNPNNFTGAPGGPGGKAIAFQSLAAGTVLSVHVGAGGSGGIYVSPGGQPGANGDLTKIELAGVLIAQGDGGMQEGAAGQATGDYLFPGDGAAGGAGGAGAGFNGASGNHGWVEIRY